MSTETIDLAIGGDVDCSPCAIRLRDALKDHTGVQQVRAVRDDTALRITLDGDRCDSVCVADALVAALPAALDTAGSDTRRPRVGVLIYRAQYAAGNTDYAHALADAIDAAGGQGVVAILEALKQAGAMKAELVVL